MSISTDTKFTSVDIGNPKAGTTTIIKPGKDYDIKGYGLMVSHHVSEDQGRFVYVRKTGDFDISTQIFDIHTDAPSTGSIGFMIRKDLNPSGMHVVVHANNNELHGETNDYVYMMRRKEGDIPSNVEGCLIGVGYYKDAEEAIAHPRPYPNVWLRLKKEGTQYTAFVAENNKTAWKKIGQFNIDLGPDPYVGMYISANEHGDKGPLNGCLGKFRDLTGF
jgi:hypothetical protein